MGRRPKTMDNSRSGSTAPATVGFLRDGGEMGVLIRAFDWANSPLGAPEAWSASLKAVVRLMMSSHHPMVTLAGPELIMLYNDPFRDTPGAQNHPATLGTQARDYWAGIWDVIGPQIDLVARGEGSSWSEEQPVSVIRDGVLQQSWWTYEHNPIDEGEGVAGVLCICRDMTGQRLAREALILANTKLTVDAAEQVEVDERQALIATEMVHRVKNILATVQALAMLTGRNAKTVAEFKATLANRIQSMAKTQDLLLNGRADRVEVREILEAELGPYLGSFNQVEFSCESMTIAARSAVSLGLLVHELLTNAAKYGALSTPGGHLTVRGVRTQEGAILDWRETTETAVVPSGESGFGTLLIERLARSLGGRAELELLATGLRAKITYTPDV